MTLPTLRILPGRLESGWRETLARLAKAGAVEKIWRREPSLWKSEEHHARVIGNRLGWLDVARTMRAEAAALAEFAREVAGAGLKDTVLLGMGGSSLAPEVFSLLFPPGDSRRFFVLDSTDPASVTAVERAVDPRSTLFIVASKSGTTVETLSQFHYFRHRAQAAGVRPPCGNFIAITDADSYLDQMAAEYGFRRVFRNPADIGGRYSALSYFGLVPAAVCGVDLAALLDGALEMARACGPEASAEQHPALPLGALLGTAALAGADKLALVATPSLAPLGNWIEQLIAESTGKEGKGIVPVAGEGPGPAALFRNAVVAVLSLEGDDRAELGRFVAALSAEGIPVAEIHLARREELGAEFFRWMLATAVAGAVLGVNPFDEPNVKESKDNTARILEALAKGNHKHDEPLVTDGGIEIFAGRGARERLHTKLLPETLRGFLRLRKENDYLALLAFLDRNEENALLLERLRRALRDALGIPVLVGFGPRYLHSIGQLYKGGPETGLFIMLTAAGADDVPVPGAGYTFGTLELAQALGDFEAFSKRRKPALRLHLSAGLDGGLARLQEAVEEALRAPLPRGK